MLQGFHWPQSHIKYSHPSIPALLTPNALVPPHPNAPISQLPKRPHSGCCMSVSSPCLSNPGSSLCLSPSHCACDCVCCDWPGLKGKHGGKGKCRTVACLSTTETSLTVGGCVKVEGGGLAQSTVQAGIMIYIREALGFILNGLEGGYFLNTFPTMVGLPAFILSETAR